MASSDEAVICILASREEAGGIDEGRVYVTASTLKYLYTLKAWRLANEKSTGRGYLEGFHDDYASKLG